MPNLTPNLWFDGNARDAAEFYVSVFPNSRITGVIDYTAANPDQEGTPVVVNWELDGKPFTGINGGPQFTPNAAVSLMIDCDGQDEVDHYWNALTADGGEEIQCGWLKDKFGFHWQVFPTQAYELIASDDAEVARRSTEAMYAMKKIDLAAMQAAAGVTVGA